MCKRYIEAMCSSPVPSFRLVVYQLGHARFSGVGRNTEGWREAGREGGVIQLSLVHLFSEFTHLDPWPARIAKLCMYVCRGGRS